VSARVRKKIIGYIIPNAVNGQICIATCRYCGYLSIHSSGSRPISLNLSRHALRIVIGSGLLIALPAGQVFAQLSAQDGYAENGGYRVQVELTPYLWLPAASGTARIGGNFGTHRGKLWQGCQL
jgi:hypothetical protein